MPISTSSSSEFDHVIGFVSYGSFQNKNQPNYFDGSNPNYSTWDLESSLLRSRDVRRMDWKLALRQGRDASTYAKTLSVERRRPVGTLKVIIQPNDDPQSYTYWLEATQWDLVLRANSSEIDLDALKAEVDLGFLGKAYKKIHAFKGATFLGELKETIGLVTRPGKLLSQKLLKHTKAVKKQLKNVKGGYYKNGVWHGDPPSADRARKIIGNEWLQFRFGVLPLLSDIDDGCYALAKFFNRRAPRELVKYSLYKKTSSVILYPNGIHVFKFTERSTSKREAQIIVRGMVKLLENGSLEPSITTHFGLSWRDAVLAGWELIPYSFVIDYFTNVGAIIQAALFPSASLLWSNRTIKTSVQNSCEIIESSIIGDKNYGIGFAAAIIKNTNLRNTEITKLVEREVGHLPVLHGLAFKVPGLTSLKWVNLGALISQRFS